MKGIDALFLAHPLFPAKKFFQLVPKDYMIGIFDNEAGDAEAVIKLGVSLGFHNWRVQMWWGGSAHALVPTNILNARLPFYNDLLQYHPLQLFLSHSCEYKSNDVTAIATRVASIRNIVPGAVAVNSLLPGSSVGGDAIREMHGGLSVTDVDAISTDGTSIFNIDARKWLIQNDGKRYDLIHADRMNLRENTKPGQVVPSPKARHAAPNDKYIISMVRILQAVEAAPVPAFKCNPFISPESWKSHSEDTQEPSELAPDDPRENKPCLISNIRGVQAVILDCKGKKVVTFPYYGALGTQSRYYSGSAGGPNLYGYEIADRAKKQSGSEWVWAQIRKTIEGPIHPAFRNGNFK